jgi:hypothetical protein
VAAHTYDHVTLAEPDESLVQHVRVCVHARALAVLLFSSFYSDAAYIIVFGYLSHAYIILAY